jgi:chemotaxis protein methyltransferase CheR
VSARAERRRPVRAGEIPPAVAAHAVTAVSDDEFELFQSLIHREAGIWLAPVKKALLVGRLARRLRELGMTSYRAYHERVREDPSEKVRMLDAICTNETHFFREPRHFELLATRVLPALREQAEAGHRARRLRVWSAACSSGEEPYSIAMALLDALPQGWDLQILATDLSTRILDRARAAVWPIEKAREIPEPHLKAFMLRGVGSQEGLMKAGPELRALVRFERLNLNGDGWPDERFDLVFCRNVLIYFERRAKERVVERLLDRLEPGGHLFLGHAESLGGLTTRARSVVPTVYTPVPPARGA